MLDRLPPHPKNAPGHFYVEFGCCTACDVPMQKAPGMFAYDENSHCYVCRQPETDDEVTSMIGAVWAAELSCIRYRGSDAKTMRRIAELGLGELSDIPPPASMVPLIRNHVEVRVIDSAATTLPQELAEAFKAYLELLNVEWSRELQNPELCRFSFKTILATDQKATLEVSWYEENYHSIVFHALESDSNSWHIEHVVKNDLGDRSLGNLIFEWLKGDPNRFADMKWYSEADWRGSKHWQSRPW